MGISLEDIPLPVLVSDADGKLVNCNSKFTELILSIPIETSTGKHLDKLFGENNLGRLLLLSNGIRDEGLTNKANTCVIKCTDGKSRSFNILKSVSEDYFGLASVNVFTFIDISAQSRAENDYTRKDRMFKLMNACNLELIRSTDKTDLLMRICQIMIEIGGYHSIWVGMTDEKNHLKTFAQWSVDDSLEQILPLQPDDWDFRFSPGGIAINTGASFIIQNLGEYKHDFKWKSYAIENNILSVASIPFYIGDSSTGIMIINSTEKNSFEHEKVMFLNDLAENITYGISYLDIFFEMKYVEQQLRQNEQKFRSVVQELVDGVAISDEYGKIIVWNNSMENIVSIAEPEMMNKYIWDFQYEISPEEIKTTENYNKIKVKLKEYLEKGVPQKKTSYERKFVCRSGETKIIESTLFSVRSSNGNLLVNIIRDITKSKHAEDEIKKLNSELEVRVIERTMQLEEALRDLKMEVNIRQRMNDELRKSKDETSKALIKEKELVGLKNRFISMISHEYRTPLTIILSSVNLIERFNSKKQPENALKYINKIKKSVSDLTLLLEDVLMIGRADAGILKANLRFIDIVQLCKESIDDVITIYNSNFKIDLNTAGTPGEVYTDPNLLKNILINLLTNACKFSGNKPVINLSLEETEASYLISVIDNGIGISEEDQAMLFTMFVRGSNSVSIPGTGLGLSIVKRCVDMLGGKLELKSRLNEGTTFVVCLPKQKLAL